jgi:hypothetical protein
MAPEQVDARPSVDVWAAGAILYELVTGERAFQAGSQPALLKQILVNDPAPLSSIRADLPSDLETVVSRALTKERMSRYPDGAALADDLARLRRGEPVLARRSGLAEKLAGRVRRAPWWMKASALVIAAAPIIGGVSWLVVSERRERAAERERHALHLEEMRAAVEAGHRALVCDLLLSESTPAKLEVQEARIDNLEQQPRDERLGEAFARASDSATCARASLGLARADPRALEALRRARREDDPDLRLLQALQDLCAGHAPGDARAGFDRLVRTLDRSPRNDVRTLAWLGLARAELDRGQPASAVQALADLAASRTVPPDLERAVDRLNQRAAGEALARNASLPTEEQRKQLKRIQDAFGPAVWRKVARTYLLDRARREDAWSIFRDDREVFAQDRDLAALARGWLQSSMTTEKDAVRALRAWEMLHAADPDQPLPDELLSLLSSTVFEVVQNGDNPTTPEVWRELAIGLTRMGWDVEIGSHVIPLLMRDGKRLVESLRREAAAKPPDWASALLLAEAVRASPLLSRHARGAREEADLAEIISERAEEIAGLAAQAHEAKDAGPTARSLARYVRGEAYILSLRGKDMKSDAARSAFALAKPELEAAVAGDVSRKPDVALEALALGHLWVGDAATALAVARRAVEAADDRSRRSTGSTAERAAACARGRPPGCGLQPVSFSMTDVSYQTRRDLIYILIALDRLDEADEVVRAYRESGIGRGADAWRALKAFVLYARGGEREAEEASRLIDEDLAASLNMARIDATVGVRILTDLLKGYGKSERSRLAAEAELKVLRGR